MSKNGSSPKSKFYGTIQEASQAAVSIGISTVAEYRERYKEDAQLPSNPRETYSKDWVAFGMFLGFLGNTHYPFESFLAIVQSKKLSSKWAFTQYAKTDRRIPPNPAITYKGEWEEHGGWEAIIFRVQSRFYVTWQEASQAARALGIITQVEYQERYKEDPKLPSNPSSQYADVW